MPPHTFFRSPFSVLRTHSGEYERCCATTQVPSQIMSVSTLAQSSAIAPLEHMLQVETSSRCTPKVGPVEEYTPDRAVEATIFLHGV